MGVYKFHMASLLLVLLSQSAFVQAATDNLPLARDAVLTSDNQEANFARLAEKFFDFRFRTNPDSATLLGFHQYDCLTPDLTAEGVKSEIMELRSFQKQFDAISESGLSNRSKIDRLLIRSRIKASLLDLEDIRSYEKNPDNYSSQAGSMVYDLISRDFSPLPERMKAVTAREKKIPAMLQAAKANLKNPPLIYTQIALEQLPGIIDLFKTSVPEKFKTVSDPALKAAFESSNHDAILSLQDYERFLKEDLLPRSAGSFALGEDLFCKKLLYEEMEDTRPAELLKQGRVELKRLQQEFIQTAKEIDPAKTTAQVYMDVSSNHCEPGKLIGSLQSVLSRLKNFCTEKDIVTIPPGEKLLVVETPPFMRALTFAAMDTPGAFEQRAMDAYYYVTLPEPDWQPQRVEEHMRAFCRYDLINTSVHEAFPGHFVQGLWERRAPSKTAMILESDSYVEGWAHYCEQMMIEEGLDGGDKNLRLVMLHDALLRCCRYIVGISMHTRGMTLDEAISFFMQEGYQERANAEREAKRGTLEPTYLVYTLGKLQLLALRKEYKDLKGSRFSLKDFHDRVLSLGAPPVKIIRQVLLSGGN